MATLCLVFAVSTGYAQLKTALEVRSLNSAQAETGPEVNVTGVVIFSDPPSTVFVQDGTAGTFFRLNGAQPPKPGDEVRIRGEAFPGLYLSGIQNATFEILSHPGLPEPLSVGFDDLASGRFHYQRVVIEGIIRSIAPKDEAASIIRVALGSRIVEVLMEQPPETSPVDWIDRRVKISGLAAGRINARRQLAAPYLRCRNWSELEAQTPPVVTESVPTVSPKQLMNFAVAGQAGHRIRVRGVVLAAFPQGEIFVRDEKSAIEIRLVKNDPVVTVGDFVEVIGFPEMKRFSASVVDAAVVAHEKQAAHPTPVVSTISDLMLGKLDGDLVSVEAVLSDWYRSKPGWVLVVQQGTASLHAHTTQVPNGISAGVKLRIPGICQVQTMQRQPSGYRALPESISLRVMSPGKIKILRAASWWTPRRLGTVLVIALIAVVLAILWIVRQTIALRRRIAHEAALEERQRIARDFHDTLEQDLAGLSLRLDAATARGDIGEKLANLLGGSRRLVSRIQTETRNLVSDLRDSPAENGDLKAVLQEIVDRQPHEAGPTIRLEIPSATTFPHLPSRTIHHLKMIASEAVTNAMKHGSAGEITITATVENVGHELLLQIADDGTGFDVDAGTRGKTGHFGCIGIRERCRKLNAQVAWTSGDSTPGTVVAVRLPL